jgi:hypothetical protein
MATIANCSVRRDDQRSRPRLSASVYLPTNGVFLLGGAIPFRRQLVRGDGIVSGGPVILAVVAEKRRLCRVAGEDLTEADRAVAAFRALRVVWHE